MVAFEYLWRREAEAGLVEARYPRPAVIVAAVKPVGQTELGVLLPITRSAPRTPPDGIPIPGSVKRVLGLDEDPSWVMVNEANLTEWPGHDLARTPGGNWSYGFLPPRLFARIHQAFRARIAIEPFSVVRR